MPSLAGRVPSRSIKFCFALTPFHDHPAFLNRAIVSYKVKSNTQVKKKKKIPGEGIQNTNPADNKAMASPGYMKEDVCIYIACFLLEFYFKFLKFVPKLQTLFVHLFGEENRLFVIFCVCFFPYHVLIYVVSHDLCRILQSPWAGIAF